MTKKLRNSNFCGLQFGEHKTNAETYLVINLFYHRLSLIIVHNLNIPLSNVSLDEYSPRPLFIYSFIHILKGSFYIFT